MAINQPDRALRLMLLQLRELPSDDFDAIVANLDAAQNQRVITLLSELEGGHAVDGADITPAQFDEVLLPAGLSPWLAARVNGSNDSGDETPDRFFITKQSLVALRHCAATLAPPPARQQPSLSLISRIWEKFA